MFIDYQKITTSSASVTLPTAINFMVVNFMCSLCNAPQPTTVHNQIHSISLVLAKIFANTLIFIVYADLSNFYKNDSFQAQ